MRAGEIIEAVAERVKAELSESERVLESELTPKEAERVGAVLTRAMGVGNAERWDGSRHRGVPGAATIWLPDGGDCEDSWIPRAQQRRDGVGSC